MDKTNQDNHGAFTLTGESAVAQKSLPLLVTLVLQHFS